MPLSAKKLYAYLSENQDNQDTNVDIKSQTMEGTNFEEEGEKVDYNFVYTIKICNKHTQ